MGAPTFAKVSHISFSATDAERSAAWWSDLFDMREIDRSKGDGWFGVLLVHPPTATILEFQQHDTNAGERFDPRRTGFDHLGFMVADRPELDAWQAYFAEKGVDYTPVVDHAYGSVLTFRDPDGIQFEMFYRDGHP
jgi:glyoxylase I family protein